MLLKRKVSLGVGVLFVHEIHGRLVVDLDDNVIAAGNHFLGEPLIRLMKLVLDDDFCLLVGA